MKKAILFIVLCLFSLLFVACGETQPKEETYKIIFYKGSEVIKEVEYKKGDQLDYPEVNLDEGFYIAWDQEIPSEINQDMIISCEVKEKKKQYSFYIDGSLVKTSIIKFSETPVDPEYTKEAGVKTFKWEDEQISDDGTTIKYNRTLVKEYYTYTVRFVDYDGNVLDEQQVEYGKSATYPTLEDEYSWAKIDISSVKSNLQIKGRKIGDTYSIKYYDGDTLIELEPKEYRSGVGAVLPTYEKDGYEFLGWFVSDISLYPYTVINEESYGDIILRTRFQETVTHTPITLPDASGHFERINKNPHSSGNGTYVYQPQFPSGFSTTVGLYTWSSSDTTIATVSQWSSITGKKAGCCIITATLNSDPTVTVNCIIKVTVDGVVAVTEEEANKIDLCTVTFLDKDDNVICTKKVVKGGSVVYPIPPIVDGFAFRGWDKVNYNIKEDTTIKAKYVRGQNNYTGKKISIIGDSISTYQDYIPAGYACFYPYPTADVNDVNMTWWMMAVNKLGAGLFINNSYSGSCAASSTGASASSNQTRLNKLVVGNERPDVVIIYMGSNDCASKYVTESDFSNGYDETITKTRTLCPEAEIVLCTLPKSNLYTEENRIAYNDIIGSYAEKYNLKVINLAAIDISNDLVDSAHPKTSGMKIVADKVVEDLLK